MASLGTFKIQQQVREALGYLAYVSYLTDLQVNIPDLPIKELENVKNGLLEYDKYIKEANKFISGKAQIVNKIAELKIQLEPEFVADEVDGKYVPKRVNTKSVLGKLPPDEIEAKRDELKKLQDELEEFDFKKTMMDARKEKLDKLKKELEDIIESQKEQYKKELDRLKDSFLKKPSPGAETINKLCDDIENDINQIIDGINSLTTIISMLIAKIPTPGAIGACVTSPPYAIEQCMTDMKQALEVFMKLITLVMSIIEKLKLLKVDKAGEIVEKIKGTDFEKYLPPPIVALIEWLRGLCKKYEDQVNDMQKQVEDAQSKAKEYLEGNIAPVYEDDDEENKKIIAYKSPLLNDDLSLKGWRYYGAIRGEKNTELQHGKIGNNTVYNKRVYYWWYDTMNNDITINTDPSTIEDGERMAAATIVNSNIKNADINATVIEYNGKHYLIDSSAKSGDVIKLPNDAGFVKLQ